MHANTIETHEALTHSAREIAGWWKGTDPMTSEAQVKKALLDTDPARVDGPEVAELLPYLVDACRDAGLLVDTAPPTTRAKILNLLANLALDVQDVLSGVAAHEARRLIATGGKLPVTMIWDVCRRDLHTLLGREPTSRQETIVREITQLYLLDQEELERATHSCPYCGRDPRTHAAGGEDACGACGLGDDIEVSP